MKAIPLTNNFITDFIHFYYNPLAYYENGIKYVDELNNFLNAIDDIVIQNIKDELWDSFSANKEESKNLIDLYRIKFTKCFNIYNHNIENFNALTKIRSDDNDLEELASSLNIPCSEVDKYLERRNNANIEAGYIFDSLSDFFNEMKKWIEPIETEGNTPKTNDSSDTPDLVTFEYDGELMAKIYKLCSATKVFNNDLPGFLGCIAAADFRKINLLPESLTKLQEITFRLKGCMGKDWYDTVCKTMGWVNNVCAGRVIKKRWTDKLQEILPRVLKD